MLDRLLRPRWPALLVAPLLVFAGLSPTPADAKRSKDRKAEAADSPAKDERLLAAYKKQVEDSESLPGALALRRKEGSLYAVLSPDDLEVPFLVHTTVARGAAIGRLLGGMQWGPDDWVFEFRKVADEVQVVRRNIRFVADEGSPMAEVVATAYSDSVQAALPVLGKDEDGGLLVPLDPYLRGDRIGVAADLGRRLGTGFELLSDRCFYGEVRNHDGGLELDVNLTFGSSRPNLVDSVPDARGLGVAVHYSILPLTRDEAFVPRPADDRVGHFLTVVADHSRQDVDGPYRRYVNRWKLEKADPDAARSPVVQPIVFYMAKTIPYEFRPYVRQGIEEWKKAFEAIGMVEAIEVRQQAEEGEDWMVTDARVNTIQWTSEAPFGGVGPSRAHPETGRMLDVDILYNASGVLRMRQRYPAFDPEPPKSLEPPTPGECDFQRGMAAELELAALHWQVQAEAAAASVATSSATSGPPEIPLEFLGASIRKTIIHEVGHVLGLRHNFKSSSVVPMAKLHDLEYTRAHALTGSIMDYPPANIAPPGEPQGEYFSSTIGPYDYWAIEYAYKPLDLEEEPGTPAYEAAQRAALDAIAAKATRPELAYASDEDRWTGGYRNLDPLSNVYDLSDDPLAFVSQRAEVVKQLWGHLLENMVAPGQAYDRARYGVRVLLGHLITAGNIAAPYVGGAYHHRDHKGDPNERPAFVPVEAAKQRAAVEFLTGTLFSDELYALTPELLNRLTISHHWHWGSDEIGSARRIDFPLHAYILKVQRPVLERLLSVEVLARLMDQERQVPAGQDAFTAAELLETMTRRIFAELEVPASEKTWTARSPYVSSTRRNLQRQYVAELARLVVDTPGAATHDAAALARAQLTALAERLGAGASQAGALDGYSSGHLRDLRARIQATLEAERMRPGL